MCGRFALTVPAQAAREHFGAVDRQLGSAPTVAALDRERHNIRPTEWIWSVVRDEDSLGDGDERAMVAMRWGFLAHWIREPKSGAPLINARSETIAEKPAFAKSARERRCLVPADGFYEWRSIDVGERKPLKEPHWIHAPTRKMIAFAGVWRLWRGGDGAEIPSVAIVTAQARGPIAALHERTPVVVDPEDYGLWLGEEGRGAARLMQPPPDSFFAHHAVSPLINKGGRHAPDGPELRSPAAEAPRSDDPSPRLI